MSRRLSFFDKDEPQYESEYKNMTSANIDDLFAYYNVINQDKEHFSSTDDICT